MWKMTITSGILCHLRIVWHNLFPATEIDGYLATPGDYKSHLNWEIFVSAVLQCVITIKYNENNTVLLKSVYIQNNKAIGT